MYWIPKMYTNAVSFRFIIASPVCNIKPLSKDITSILKLFYEKVEKVSYKSKSMVRNQDLFTIQDSYPIISSINKLNKRKTAKVYQLLIFQSFTVYNSGAFWHNSFLQVRYGKTRVMSCELRVTSYELKA